ncbi:MAG: response regulator [Lachnospiraceae bacterium]|nr:response regulator [Lachnospiraceae bacterium]
MVNVLFPFSTPIKVRRFQKPNINLAISYFHLYNLFVNYNYFVPEKDGGNMYNLLIVDDKDVFCRMITRMAYFENNQDKFRIKKIAKNGLEALNIITSGDIDIVLTDIRMPLMNGIDLLKEINKKELCRCTILLSEYSEFSYAKEGIINGAFDYIVKPVNDTKLRETFDRAYIYLKSLTDRNSLLQNRIVQLTNSLSEDDNLFATALKTITSYITDNSNTDEERVLLINEIFDKFSYQMSSNYKFISKYIPIEKICKIKYNHQSELSLIGIFNFKIHMIRNSLFKFKFNISCPNIQKICDFILLNIDTDLITLQNISEQFYINKKYLSTLFKKETGIRFTDFVNYYKIEHAKILLTYSNLKLYDVAEKLGFIDTDYFSRLFKKQTGLTPRNFNWNNYIEIF